MCAVNASNRTRTSAVEIICSLCCWLAVGFWYFALIYTMCGRYHGQNQSSTYMGSPLQLCQTKKQMLRIRLSVCVFVRLLCVCSQGGVKCAVKTKHSALLRLYRAETWADKLVNLLITHELLHQIIRHTHALGTTKFGE